MSVKRPGGSGNILTDMINVVGDAIIQGIGQTVEELSERGHKAREQTAAAENERGALLLDTSDMSDLAVKAFDRFPSSYVTDERNGNTTSWQFPWRPGRSYHSMKPGEARRAHWTLYGKVANGRTPLIAEIEGAVTPGWRDGIGITPLVTIEHVHRKSFFPYSDALYADEFPANRLAAMLNAAWLAQKGSRPLIVIDRREALRREQTRIAATEDRSKASLLPRPDEHGLLAPRPIEPGPQTTFASPDGAVRYDAEAKTTFDPRSGLTMKIEQSPGRDDDAYRASLRKAGEIVAVVELYNENAWRPDAGETGYVLVNRVTSPKLPNNPHIFGENLDAAQMPLALLVPLLNGYQRFSSNQEGIGHLIIRDGRDRPISLQR